MAPKRRVERADRGIYRVHPAACKGARDCDCPYEATVHDPRSGRRLRKRHPKLREARLWRGEMQNAIERGDTPVTACRLTVTEAAEALLAGMRDGTVTSRSQRPYKPATVRRYERALRLHVLPSLAPVRLTAVTRARVRELARQWLRSGLDPSTIHNNLDPLRVIFREAIEDGLVTVDPMLNLRLPRPQGRRERVADRGEAQQLIDAAPADQQAFWACAFYGGLRRGELRALRWTDLDLEAGVIRVERTWDDQDGEQPPKTDAGSRRVPLAGTLRRTLVAHKLATGRGEEDLVFGRTRSLPFIPSTIRTRANEAWKAAGLTPITPHEARHSAASYLIEAGLNDLELTATIGHSDPRTTKTIYGHLFPDSTSVIAAKMDLYLDASPRTAVGTP